jgi:hypothetical protein
MQTILRTIRRVVLVGSGWWDKWTTTPGYRARVRRTTVIAVLVVILSIVVAKLLWGNSGPGFFTPLVYAALFFAATILFAVAILSSDEFVDELEASHPPRVRNRAGFVRHAKRTIRVLSAGISAVDAILTRNLTRESITRWSHAAGVVLCGVPPAGTVLRGAGRLARPVSAPPPTPVPAPRSTERRSRRARRARHARHARRTRRPRRGPLAVLGWRLPSRRRRSARTRNRARSSPPARNRRRTASRADARLSDSSGSGRRSRRTGT